MSLDGNELNKILNLLNFQKSVTDLERKIAVWTQLNQTQYVVGDIIEMGCWRGGTSVLIQYLKSILSPQKEFHIYDGFQGLYGITEHDGNANLITEGNLSANEETLKKAFQAFDLENPIVHKKLIQDIKDADLPLHISFVFLDVDLYEPTKTAMELIWPKMTMGSCIIIDDYNFEPTPGINKAVDEFFSDKNVDIRKFPKMAMVRKWSL